MADATSAGLTEDQLRGMTPEQLAQMAVGRLGAPVVPAPAGPVPTGPPQANAASVDPAGQMDMQEPPDPEAQAMQTAIQQVIGARRRHAGSNARLFEQGPKFEGGTLVGAVPAESGAPGRRDFVPLMGDTQQGTAQLEREAQEMNLGQMTPEQVAQLVLGQLGGAVVPTPGPMEAPFGNQLPFRQDVVQAPFIADPTRPAPTPPMLQAGQVEMRDPGPLSPSPSMREALTPTAPEYPEGAAFDPSAFTPEEQQAIAALPRDVRDEILLAPDPQEARARLARAADPDFQRQRMELMGGAPPPRATAADAPRGAQDLTTPRPMSPDDPIMRLGELPPQSPEEQAAISAYWRRQEALFPEMAAMQRGLGRVEPYALPDRAPLIRLRRAREALAQPTSSFVERAIERRGGI